MDTPFGDTCVRVDGGLFARWSGGGEPDELATSFPLSSGSEYSVSVEPLGANTTFKWAPQTATPRQFSMFGRKGDYRSSHQAGVPPALRLVNLYQSPGGITSLTHPPMRSLLAQ